MKKIFLGQNELRDGYIFVNPQETNHIMNALRYKVGQELLVSDQKEKEYLTEIEGYQGQELLLRIKESRPLKEEKTQIILVQGLPKADKMEYIIQKAVELGAVEIVPLQTMRSLVKLEGSKADKRRERWQKIADQAARQSGASQIARLADIVTLKEYLKNIPEDFTQIVLWEEEEELGLGQLLNSIEKIEGHQVKVALIIGPEGGLDPAEVDLLLAAGARTVSLGERILRTETASLAALSLVQYHFGELG